MKPTFAIVAAGVAFAFAWFFAGPAQLGGGATYVTTHGDSMEPRITAGDLVLVRAADSYEVGDAVAYRSEQLRTVVLHRIVDVEDGRYVLQGDNNSWLDPEQPARSELIGKQWLHIPSGGRWLRRLTSPAALGAAAFLLLSGGGAAASNRRRLRKEHPPMATSLLPRRRTVAAMLPSSASVAAGVATLGLLGALLGGLAWTRPVERPIAEQKIVTSTIEFSYTASVPSSPAYDDTTVTAPQAVFRNLTDTVDVEFRYRGRPGTVTVDAELGTASGWRSTVRLADPVRFDGTEYADTVRLDLPGLQARAEAAAAVIGLPTQALDVTIVPTVSLDGGGVLTPRLALTLDDIALRLRGDQTLTVEESMTVAGSGHTPATLSAFGIDLPVSTARTLSLAAVAAAIVLAALLAAALRLRPLAESERIRRRHRQLLLPVAPIALPPGRPVIDVADVEALIKLAERYGLLVLHWSRSGVDTFVVQDSGTTYRHRAHGGAQPHGVALAPPDGDAATTAIPDEAPEGV